MIEQYVSPSEFRRLLSALSVVLGFIAIAVIFAFSIVPGLRYQAHTSAEDTILPVIGESGWLDPTDYPESPKRIIPPIDPKSVMTPNPDLLARGKTLFAQTCATCHGNTGAGDGNGGKGLNPRPRNFTVAEGWKNGSSIEDIFRTLEQGVKGSAMVSYNYLSKKDRMALVHYVQSLGTFTHKTSEPEARQALEQLFSSVGETIPNKIPVAKAMAKLAEEKSARPVAPVCQSTTADATPIWEPVRAAQVVAAVPADATDGDFAKQIVAGAPANGFSVRVGTFSASQWNQLRRCAATQ